jgi:hypothetical protein
MYVYKFKDKRDGNYAFIFSDSKENAVKKMESMTELEFEYINYRDALDVGTWIIFNEIKDK